MKQRGEVKKNYSRKSQLRDEGRRKLKKKMVGLGLEDDLWIWDEANGES